MRKTKTMKLLLTKLIQITNDGILLFPSGKEATEWFRKRDKDFKETKSTIAGKDVVCFLHPDAPGAAQTKALYTGIEYMWERNEMKLHIFNSGDSLRNTLTIPIYVI